MSLFPGIGLLDQAFEEEEFCIVRGPDVLWGGDVRRFHPPAGVFDGVIGGPPCQAFSTLSNLVRARGYEPRFGDLFPEFARVVAEARPAWFLCENVDTKLSRAAAENAFAPLDHHVHTFTFGNEALGEEQRRLRRFWFGDGALVDLRRWIQLAPLMLPGRSGAITQTHVDNSAEAKGRVGTVTHTPAPGQRVPVARGGSSKLKPGARNPAVLGRRGARKPAVTGAHSGAAARPKGGRLVVYQWQEMLRLQGLPPDFLEDAPFTVQGKRKAVANGVPLPMGRAIARAVRRSLEPACPPTLPQPASSPQA